MTVAATGTTSLVDVLVSIGVEVTNVGEREIGGRCPVHIARTGKAEHGECGKNGSAIGSGNEYWRKLATSPLTK